MKNEFLANRSFRILLSFFISVISISSFAADATYEVPVKSDRLKAFAKFTLSDLEVHDEAGEPLEVRFTLPHELVGGKEVQVHLQQIPSTDDAIVNLEGDNAKATCKTLELGEHDFDCSIKYENQDKYSAKIFLYLLNEGFDHPIRRARVAAKFSNDPLGILKFSKKGN